MESDLPAELVELVPEVREEAVLALLSPAELETLRHLVRSSVPHNTKKAYGKDLVYLEAWARAATGEALPWPPPAGLLVKFVLHHLFDPVERAREPGHGMPAEVEGELRARGALRALPHRPATVERRLAAWKYLTGLRGLPVEAFAEEALRRTLRAGRRADPRPKRKKSARAVDRELLERLTATCSPYSLRGARDRALLELAWASGGRRRSEVARLAVEDLETLPDQEVRDGQGRGQQLTALRVHLGRTKTTIAAEDAGVLVVGRPADSLEAWLRLAGIEGGPIFRSIDRQGRLGERALTPETVNRILKARAQAAGLDPAEISAHGLRSGYLTQACHDNVPLAAAMAQSKHRSVKTAIGYYDQAAVAGSRAARLLE
ncbi:Phage integrase family protein [Tistlia consotensis]|uniref:Phage integrase family protein n=1 Tax=Tistlia consotensis USBA 355 TaxID=560819 RepID=A0A1Y6CQ87_9PROT|nr:tyrosine-type recombinase/integrase [Tistlia consotensis]SMF82162.1 Phage integrase family protein [Tistlia consotensis USBA 355]SNS25756.1 Phage integrase family protein [Tistlia consotensis]